MKVSFFSRRAAKNAGWLVAGRILHMALAFLVNLLTARYLGPSNYGLVNYAALYTAFFTSFATLGLSSLLLKDFMDDPEGAGTTVGTAIAMRLLSSTLSAVSILAIVAAVDRGERLTMTVVALYSMSLIFQAFDTGFKVGWSPNTQRLPHRLGISSSLSTKYSFWFWARTFAGLPSPTQSIMP